MPGTAQITGIASGIDWETTIAQLMAIERQPVTLLEERKGDLQQKLSLWASLQAKVLGLQSACEAMDTRSEFAVKSATSSDSTIVSVTAEAGAEPGNHSIRVLGLAQVLPDFAAGFLQEAAELFLQVLVFVVNVATQHVNKIVLMCVRKLLGSGRNTLDGTLWHSHYDG